MSKKEEISLKIIQAATKVFLDDGFKAASMRRIAELAEVSSRTLYKYYPSKDDLYSSLLDELLNQTEKKFSFCYERKSPIKKQLEKIFLLKAELVFSDSYMNISKIVLGELLRSKKPTVEQMDRINNSESLFVSWVKEAQKDNKVIKKISAEEIAEQFHALFKSKLYWPILFGITDKESIDLKKVMASVINFFAISFIIGEN